jgi:trigger factor
MDFEIKDQEKSKKEMIVTIPMEEMEEHLDQAANALSQEMNIKGFRPGNAPREVVENSIGKDKVWQEAVSLAIEKSYPEIIKKEELFPISQPEVEFNQNAAGNDLIYKAKFYVMPEFELPNYKELASEVMEEESVEVDVDPAEIEQTIERIQKSRAISREVEREAKDKDEVKITFSGKIDKEEEVINKEDLEFTLGEGQFNSLEGFEDHIIGMKAGDDKNFSIKIEEDNPNKELAGKEIEFDLKLESVSEKELPELTDDFANSLHKDVSGMDELKEKIEEGIKSEKEARKKEKVKMEIVQKLIKNTDLDIPEVLVERELDNMKQQMERRVQQMGKSFEDYLEEINKSEEDLRNEWTEKAEDNVAAAIILHKVAEKENIEPTEEEIEEEIDNHFAASGRNKEEESEENLKRLRGYVGDMIKNQKIFDFLME